MSYATGEAAALTIIQALSAWDSDNSYSAANDSTFVTVDTLLISGDDDKYCVLLPGEFEREPGTISGTEFITHWQTRIQIYVLVQPSGDAPEKRLASLRNDIINALDGYQGLNGQSGVWGAMVTTGGEIFRPELAEGAERAFITQELILEWDEETTVTQNG